MFTIREGLEIADRWLEIRTSRSGGPGGQHVNKVSSRVELRLDLRGCDDLSPRVKSRLRALAGQRITKDGVLRFVCSSSRDQLSNRMECEEKLRALILEALKPPPAPRKAPRVPPSAKRRRLEAKRRRSATKKGRKWSPDRD